MGWILTRGRGAETMRVGVRNVDAGGYGLDVEREDFVKVAQ